MLGFSKKANLIGNIGRGFLNIRNSCGLEGEPGI